MRWSDNGFNFRPIKLASVYPCILAIWKLLCSRYRGSQRDRVSPSCNICADLSGVSHSPFLSAPAKRYVKNYRIPRALGRKRCSEWKLKIFKFLGLHKFRALVANRNHALFKFLTEFKIGYVYDPILTFLIHQSISFLCLFFFSW